MATETIALEITANGDVAEKTLGDLKKEVKELGNDAKGIGDGLSEGINSATSSTANLKMQLRQMKEDLAKLPEGSAEFKKLATAAGEVQDKINMINQTIKSIADNKFNIHLQTIAQAGSAIAGGFQAAQGAAALFGSENEAVAKAIQNVIAVQGIMNGVQMVTNALQDDAILGIKVRQVLEKAQIGLTKALTAAQRVLNSVMNKNPISLIVIAVMALVGAVALLIKNLEYAKNVLLSLFGLYDRQALIESKASKARLEQFKKEVDAISEKRRVEKESFDSRQKQFDLTIARMEAEGKNSNKLKLQKLQDALDETKAVLKANEDIIAATVKRYETEASLRGLSRDEFLKSIGIDAAVAEKQINDQLQTQRDAIYSAETNLLALKTQIREKNNADVKTKQDELDAIALKAYEAELKRLHDLQAEQARVLDEVLKLENAYEDSKLSAQQREINASRDKYFALIEQAEQFGIDTALLKEAQEAELLAIEQKYLDLEFDAMEAQIDKENELRKAQQEQEQADRQKRFDDTIALSEQLISIAENLNGIAHKKELARIKQKQDAGIRLTKSEEARLRRQEKIQKAFALAQIVKDTAMGVASAVRAGAGVPFPGNLLAIASGVAAVVAGIKNASDLLGGAPPSIPETAAEAQEATGNEETNIPNPVQAGSTFLNQEPQMVYVLEKDITSVQNGVNAIVAEATFK